MGASETTGKNRQYHFEMMMKELVGLHIRHRNGLNGGDTRSYLSLDLAEQEILIEILEAVTGSKNYVVAAGPALEMRRDIIGEAN